MPLRLLRAFVAVLALTLSALGSPRSAWERPCDFWDGDDCLAASTATTGDVLPVAGARRAAPTAARDLRMFPRAAVCPAAPIVSSADLDCPGPRCGSARGARAPDAAA
jgi:hypothetical protein